MVDRQNNKEDAHKFRFYIAVIISFFLGIIVTQFFVPASLLTPIIRPNTTTTAVIQNSTNPFACNGLSWSYIKQIGGCCTGPICYIANTNNGPALFTVQNDTVCRSTLCIKR